MPCVIVMPSEAAVASAFAEFKLVVEPGGAVALATLLGGKSRHRGQGRVATPSRGNADPDVFSRLAA